MFVTVWIAMTCDSKIAYAVGKHPQKSLYLKNPEEENAFGKRHRIQYFLL